MRVLVACEFSGVVRRAFRERGHEAFSLDLLPTEDESPHHIQADLLEWSWGAWDLMIAHPPCTDLAISGARWHIWSRIMRAIEFVDYIANAPVPRICIENPVGMLNTHWRKPDQMIQPWMFGHAETKATCLWLRNLPSLVPSSRQPAAALQPRVHMMGQSKDRWKKRSRTYDGIAAAMADQWGELPPLEWMPIARPESHGVDLTSIEET